MTTLQQAIAAPFVRVRARSITRGRADNRRFIVILSAVVLVGAMGLLSLNALNTAGAFEIKALQKQSADLQVQQQQIGERVSKAQSPGRLARAAAALGMVPASDPVFIVVKDDVNVGAGSASPSRVEADSASGPRPAR